jgi:hypothetical protein
MGDNRALPGCTMRQSGAHSVTISDSAWWWCYEQGNLVRYCAKENPRTTKRLYQISAVNPRYAVLPPPLSETAC